jgi:hypothetical protein
MERLLSDIWELPYGGRRPAYAAGDRRSGLRTWRPSQCDFSLFFPLFRSGFPACILAVMSERDVRIILNTLRLAVRTRMGSRADS